jgi:hypothetical protein
MGNSFSGGSDLFDPEPSIGRTNDRPESAALVEVLKALRAHPSVDWCERMNSGVAKVGNRYIRFGWTGCSDLLGMLRDGRILAVEVKSPSGKLRPAQAVFLDRVKAAGGVGFMARDLRDVHRCLQHMPAIPSALLAEPAHVVTEVTRVRDCDQDPALFDETTGEFFSRQPKRPRQEQQAVDDILAELKCKAGSANDFGHRPDTPATRSPQKKILPSPASSCSPPPTAK